MNWMVPEHHLDEYQLSVLQSCRNLTGKTQWIKGFAGSGKSVLLVHLVQRLLAENPNLSISVAVFTHALKDLLYTGFPEQVQLNIRVMTYHKYLRDRKKYDFVAVDEIQDIPIDKIEQIKGLTKHMVFAGDIDQSIYGECSTANEIEEIFDPEIHRLVTIYRLTQKIRDIVQTILPNSQIENAPTARMQEVDITLAKAESEDEEIKWVWEQCCRYAIVGDPAVILLPTHEEVQNFIRKICEINEIDSPIFHGDAGGRSYEPINELFQESGVDLQYLGNNFGKLNDSDDHALTYIMTYHSAKGLDFETVFLPHLNKGKTIFRDTEIEPRLFFVAMTRSRRNLFLSYSSEEPIHYVTKFPQNLLHKISCNADLAEQPHLIIPDEDGNHIKEEFTKKIVGLLENKTDLNGEVITTIIKDSLKDVITEKLIAQYQKDESFQNILIEMEAITDEMEVTDVFNKFGSIINKILINNIFSNENDDNENDDNKPYIPF